MKSFVLSSASALAMVTGGSAALAQTTHATATPAGQLEEVIVTGVRQSIEDAQVIKQDAAQIVDAIVAEDIGKLPDNSVAEALQRVTGVQITRSRGEAASSPAIPSGVLIRGLPNIVTTLNDRQIFTTTGRGIALPTFRRTW